MTKHIDISSDEITHKVPALPRKTQVLIVVAFWHFPPNQGAIGIPRCSTYAGDELS